MRKKINKNVVDILKVATILFYMASIMHIVSIVALVVYTGSIVTPITHVFVLIATWMITWTTYQSVYLNIMNEKDFERKIKITSDFIKLTNKWWVRIIPWIKNLRSSVFDHSESWVDIYVSLKCRESIRDKKLMAAYILEISEDVGADKMLMHYILRGLRSSITEGGDGC